MGEKSVLFLIVIVLIILGVLYNISFVLGVIATVGLLAFIIYLLVILIKGRSKKIASKEQSVYSRGSPDGYIIDHSYYTKVVGVTYSGRQRILASLQDGMDLDFVRETHNVHDKNAVAIYCSNRQIGYLSREEAAEIAPIMDKGIPVDGVIEHITGGGKYNYGCEIRVKIYKRKAERKREPKQELKPTVENIDTSNPLYGKTCVLFDYSYPDEEQNIVNLGGILRRSVSGKTDYYIVKDFYAFYNSSTVQTNKVRELMQNGGKIKLLSDEEYLKIKEQYLPRTDNGN